MTEEELFKFVQGIQAARCLLQGCLYLPTIDLCVFCGKQRPDTTLHGRSPLMEVDVPLTRYGPVKR